MPPKRNPRKPTSAGKGKPTTAGASAARGDAVQRDSTGAQIGKYRLIKRLGSGGMGAVYLAEDTALGRKIALKVLPRDKARNPTLVARFEAEAKAAAGLSHDNIVAVYEAGGADGYLYIALEYVDGTDVFELVTKRGPLPVKRTIDIIRQVTSALDHAAERGIVHRDIKPANLLIRSNGTVKLTDLGLARSIEAASDAGITRAGHTVGTVDYMPPEQARDSKLADVRSDLYSLGCTWFFMLTGRVPFPDGDLMNKLYAHGHDPRPNPRDFNPKVPEGVAAVLERMMAKSPESRHQTPKELLRDLDHSMLTNEAVAGGVLAALEDDDVNPDQVYEQRQFKGGRRDAPPPSPRSQLPPGMETDTKSDADVHEEWVVKIDALKLMPALLVITGVIAGFYYLLKFLNS